MFYYDEEGELQTTTDPETARRYHALTVLRSANYPLAPRAAAGLVDEVGRIDKQSAAGDIQERASRALREAGLGGMSLDVELKRLFEDAVAEVRANT